MTATKEKGPIDTKRVARAAAALADSLPMQLALLPETARPEEIRAYLDEARSGAKGASVRRRRDEDDWGDRFSVALRRHACIEMGRVMSTARRAQSAAVGRWPELSERLERCREVLVDAVEAEPDLLYPLSPRNAPTVPAEVTRLPEGWTADRRGVVKKAGPGVWLSCCPWAVPGSPERGWVASVAAIAVSTAQDLPVAMREAEAAVAEWFPQLLQQPPAAA
jgi:hypothetical protein